MDHIRAESLRDKAKNLHRLADAQELELRSPVKVELVPLSSLRPCPENDGLYGAQSIEDPDIVSLIKSIRDIGVTDPIRISTDNIIISGHRRRFCAFQAGVRMVPVIREPISYYVDRQAFLKRLVEANEQRKKSAAMLMREAAMKVDPDQAYEELRREQQEAKDERRFGSRISDEKMHTSSIAGRKMISKAKEPMLQACINVINEHRAFWPLSVRQIHYRLLNDPPLKHASKPDSTYENDEKSYKALVDLLARARVENRFPWPAIADETRPEELNNDFWNAGEYTESAIKRFLAGYRRNRQQSQPAHIEIVAEKLTVRSILEDIAADHSIPLSISRGHNGPTMKRKIAQRFKVSKKDTLIVLVVSDLDPAGEAIVQNMHDDLIDDHGISEDQLEVYRAGLTMTRVEELSLEPSYDTEEKDISTKQAFIDKYGTTDAYELEAMEPEALQEALTEDIDDVLDIDAYNAELEREKDEAVTIKTMKDAVTEYMRGWQPPGDQPPTQKSN